ncbi:MAG: hypothetical protein AAFY56_13505, partial [Pseudomonadota bacterium]
MTHRVGASHATGRAAPQAGPTKWNCHIDAHVHLYPRHVLSHVFAAVQRNVLPAADINKSDYPPLVVLLLANTRSAPERALTDNVLPGWSIARPEPGAAVVRREPGPPIVLLTGCQLQTCEGLELLGLGTDQTIP